MFCINPLVAYDASAGGRRKPDGELTDRGLTVVLGQTFRSLIQSRMMVGMTGYGARFPESDLLLFEPDRDDARMFFATVFRYADRRRLVDHAYQRARADLRRHADTLEAVLAVTGSACVARYCATRTAASTRRSISSARPTRGSCAT